MGYRILFLNWQDIRHPLGGGAEVYNHEVLKRLAARNHHITIVCCSHPTLPPVETIDGIRIIRYGGRRWFNYAAPFAVRRLLKTESFDIAIDAINKIPLMAPLYVRKIPVLGLVHHIFRKSIFREASPPAASYVYAFEQLIKPVYRRVPFIVISESTGQDLISIGIPENRIFIVECSVDFSLYRTSSEPKSPVPLVGYVGRIKRYKSVDHLIKAFVIVKRHIPDSQLVIVGDGDTIPELQQLTSELGIADCTEFTGFVDQETKVKILQKCYVVVNPSIKEGWGLTVIEANACGTPTVAADVPGLRDSVKNGETGFLYPYGDIEQCARYIMTLLQNEDIRTKITTQAIQWAAQFSWDTAADKTLSIIEKTITEHKN